jgi:hypothetical protein
MMGIRKTVGFILVMIVSIEAESQSLRFGLKGGVQISDVVLANFVNTDIESDYKIKGGIHFGAYSSAPINDRFALDAELLYTNKGTNAGERINLHYINIPFLLRYQLSEKFSAAVGPEFGYLFSARSAHGDVSNTWNNKLDFGLDADALLAINKKIGLGLRYFAGFSSVIDTRRSTTGETVKYQNRALLVSMYFLVGEK